jgi:hypothetical protein
MQAPGVWHISDTPLLFDRLMALFHVHVPLGTMTVSPSAAKSIEACTEAWLQDAAVMVPAEASWLMVALTAAAIAKTRSFCRNTRRKKYFPITYSTAESIVPRSIINASHTYRSSQNRRAFSPIASFICPQISSSVITWKDKEIDNQPEKLSWRRLRLKNGKQHEAFVMEALTITG